MAIRQVFLPALPSPLSISLHQFVLMYQETTTNNYTSYEGQPPNGVTYRAAFHLLAIAALCSLQQTHLTLHKTTQPSKSTNTNYMTALTSHMHRTCGLGANRQCCHMFRATPVSISLTKQLQCTKQTRLTQSGTNTHHIALKQDFAFPAGPVGQPASYVGCTVSCPSALNWSYELIEPDTM